MPDAHGVTETSCPPLQRPTPGRYAWRIDYERVARIARAVQTRTPPGPVPVEEQGWEFLSGTAYDRVAARLRGETVDEAALLEELTSDSVFIVIRTVERRLPRLVHETTESATGRFEPGFFVGAVFVMDRATARPLCWAPVQERSSDSVVFDANLIYRQMEQITNDFTRRVRLAIDTVASRIAPGVVEAPPGAP